MDVTHSKGTTKKKLLEYHEGKMMRKFVFCLNPFSFKTVDSPFWFLLDLNIKPFNTIFFKEVSLFDQKYSKNSNTVK